jgi:hypothetical protein
MYYEMYVYIFILFAPFGKSVDIVRVSKVPTQSVSSVVSDIVACQMKYVVQNH